MLLQHESTVRNENGLFEVSVYIDRKKCSYLIPNQKTVSLFNFYYSKKKLHGRAIALLNKFQVKEEGRDEVMRRELRGVPFDHSPKQQSFDFDH